MNQISEKFCCRGNPAKLVAVGNALNWRKQMKKGGRQDHLQPGIETNLKPIALLTDF